MKRRRITIERIYQATLEDVWEMWTTPEGLEAWWGPDGFSVKVRELDLRPGGLLRYAMTADAPQQIAFMKQHNMPLTTEALVTYSEVVPMRRLGFVHRADFIPNVEPYDVDHVVEFEQTRAGVRVVLTIEAMHDDEWTGRAVMGWENELGRLERALAA